MQQHVWDLSQGARNLSGRMFQASSSYWTGVVQLHTFVCPLSGMMCICCLSEPVKYCFYLLSLLS